MFKIGEMSRLCALPVKTLRYYDAIGLLVPAEVDRFTGYRYYIPAQLGTVERIVALKALGFSLEEIRVQLGQDDALDLDAMLARRMRALREEIAGAELSLRRLETIRAKARRGEAMLPMNIRTGEKMRVAMRREVFADRAAAELALDALTEAIPAAKRGLRRVMVNYEAEHKTADLDLGIGVELTGELPVGVDAAVCELDLRREMATVVCRRALLTAAYADALIQLDACGRHAQGAAVEVLFPDGTVALSLPLGGRETVEPIAQKEEFADDSRVIGQWRLLDIVPTREQFCDGHPKSSWDTLLTALYFLPNGASYWCYGGWTRGCLYTLAAHRQDLFWCNPYTVETVGGRSLLFLERLDVQDGALITDGLSSVWVYEQVDGIARTKEDIRRRDKTDLPHVPDDAILGQWVVRDLVREIDQFETTKQNFADDRLYLRGLTFAPDGDAVYRFADRVIALRWTKGSLLDERRGVAEGYCLREIDGEEYLFVEWKSGDYLFGNHASRYVFVRA